MAQPVIETFLQGETAFVRGTASPPLVVGYLHTQADGTIMVQCCWLSGRELVWADFPSWSLTHTPKS